MTKKCAIAGGLLLVAVFAKGANYTAEKISVDGIAVVRLTDAVRQVVVSIKPGAGNLVSGLTVHGKEVLAPAGIPLLAPWANRLDQDGFWANGKKYLLNSGLQTVHYDNNHLPIHGLLAAAAWKMIALSADENRAEMTAELEFWRHPDWMAQFPFAHTIAMTLRLHDGALEVETKIDNLSDDPMPVSIGYHPWFHLSDAPRDEWRIHIAARDHIKLSKVYVPTGEHEPVTFPDPVVLKGVQLDDVFGDLVRDDRGEASFSIEGNREKITVTLDPNYRNAVVYAPHGCDVVCMEPMSGPTNAFNMAHDGTYKDLVSIAPRGQWRATFRVKAEGF
jgi:aldose 1-epimerase